jgi:hypothetical protein
MSGKHILQYNKLPHESSVQYKVLLKLKAKLPSIVDTRIGLDTGYRHTTNSEASTYAIYVFGRIHEGIISNK